MADNPKHAKEFHARLFIAWTAWEGRHQRRLTQTAFGEMMGRLLGGGPVGQSTVNDWLKRQVPSIELTGYMAKVLEVSRCWLAYGDGPGPHDPLAAQKPVPQPNRR